ncbi:efflux RND transporter permease subunit [Candidatus Gracilibacteria bacterium]|nr:efflux RND transporter permease subunit [Candidatus Gracilibacteria bacterium]
MTASKKDFNYRITEFFLNNSRLTILSLILLILLSAISLSVLKTTGFPNPTVNIAIVTTIYPGASSDTVSRDVTKPIEGALKNITGIESYTSVSRNSTSVISVSIDTDANIDTVQNKISTAVRSLKLPTGTEAPQISVPQIGTPDFIFSLAATDKATLYTAWDQFRDDLNEIADTSTVTPLADLKQRVLIKLDIERLTSFGLTIEEVQRQIASVGETLPVISNVTIDGSNETISTKIAGDDFETLRNLRIYTQTNATRSQIATSIALSDIAQISKDYYFENNDSSYVGIRVGGQSIVLPALVITIKTAAYADKVAYAEELVHKIEQYNEVHLVGEDWYLDDTNEKPVLFIQNLSANDSTKEQVNEVVTGLIGGKLKTESIFANLGWFLGGIQLVFLAMLLFVSWRAAIISAAAIPLSLVFSFIYLYLTGESLNTLVLFSLVLVLGLVVDPALVIIESIQRSIDMGHKGKEAALLAVKDVGGGLFLATLTNVIVFLPFGVISGVLGQIFSYIPLTIIPATIGSYIVPLVLLAWFGGAFLKPTKGKTNDEEKNLWFIARWLIQLNSLILHSRVWVRLIIMTIALIMPFMVVGALISSGSIKFAQFASSQNSQYLAVSGTFLPTKTQAETQIIKRQIIETIVERPYIKQVFAQSNRLSLQIELVAAEERPDTKSVTIASEIQEQLNQKFGSYLFDISVGVQGNGPPGSAYKVSIAIKTDDLDLLEKGAKDVGKTLLMTCKTNGIISINPSCPDDQKMIIKIDDGYTGKENQALDILIDLDTLYSKQFISPAGPLTTSFNQQIKRLFNIADEKKISSIKVAGDETDVVLEKVTTDPHTRDDLTNQQIKNTLGESYTLGAVATLQANTPKDTIQGVKGQVVGTILGRLRPADDNETGSAAVIQAVVDYYQQNNAEHTTALGLPNDAIEKYSEGSSASFTKSFQELLLALVLAIVMTYFVLAVFFGSLGLPLVILFTVPLTFIGVFPALASFTSGEFGFLEIIGLIILVGVVENVAIFLIDAALQKINYDNWDEKRAISFASGVRLRPVILTQITAIASLAPLAFLSEFYRSISIVIIFGLLTSGFTSLITTPILFIFFRWLSRSFQALPWWHKVLFFPLLPFYIVGMGISNRKKIDGQTSSTDQIQ